MWFVKQKKSSYHIWYSPVTIAWRVDDGAKNPCTHGLIACYMPEWQMNGFYPWAFELHPSISIQYMVLEIGRPVDPRDTCLAWVLCFFDPVPEDTYSMFFLLEKSWDALMLWCPVATWIRYRYTMDMSGMDFTHKNEYQIRFYKICCMFRTILVL